MADVFGKNIKQETIDELFLTGPGENLVAATVMQLTKIAGIVSLFGVYDPKREDNRISDYQRFDWSTRMLPAMNIFESGDEQKESDEAFLRGTITFQIFWPPNFRRSDSRRVEVAFKGMMQNFFSSDYVAKMLDELYFIQRPEKVYGLNEYGKTLSWMPNSEGLVGDELCPVTILNVQYRIDLRSWYRAMEYQGRTKGNPFEKTLYDLVLIGGLDNNIMSAYQGDDDKIVTHVEIPEQIKVSNP